MKKIIAFSIILVAFTASVFSQANTVQTTATATIIGPLTLTKVSDMNFGNIAVTGTAGTVVLATTGVRTPTGVALVPPAAGTPASFTVAGEGTRAFGITLPLDGTVTLILGANTMAVTGFNHNLGATPALVGGAAAFTVGATLSVAANQAPGVYNSANFPVTVNYN